MPSFQVRRRAGLELSAPVRWQAWTTTQHSTYEHEAGADNRNRFCCYCCCSLCFVLFVVAAAASCCYCCLLRVLSLGGSGGTAVLLIVYSAAATAVTTLLFDVATTECSGVCSPRSRGPCVFCGSSVCRLFNFCMLCIASPLPCPLRLEGFIFCLSMLIRTHSKIIMGRKFIFFVWVKYSRNTFAHTLYAMVQ